MICIRAYIYIYLYIYRVLFIHISKYVHTYMCTYTHSCMYIHIHIHSYKHIYIHIYKHIHIGGVNARRALQDIYMQGLQSQRLQAPSLLQSRPQGPRTFFLFDNWQKILVRHFYLIFPVFDGSGG